MQHSEDRFISLKTAFAAVLKTMRISRGLTQQHLSQASSRTYLSKLERAQSSLTLDKLNALSDTLRVSPLTLMAVTLGAERGQAIETLISQMEAEVAELAESGVLTELAIPRWQGRPAVIASGLTKRMPSASAPSQAEFCFTH